MEAFQVHILAADHTFYEGPCESLVVPTVDGEAGILAHHCNIIAAVVPGELRCRTPEGEKYRAAVSEGLVKVEGGDVLVLVDSAERPEEIDANRARRAAAVISPMLITFLGMDPYMAVGIALASDVLASAISAYTYGKNGNLDIKNGAVMMASVLCFTLVGSYVASLVPGTTMGGFSTFMTLLLGVKFIVRPVMTTKSAMNAISAQKRFAQSLLCGAGVGFICGFIGAGGGMMMLLLLTSVLGYELKTAVGTSVFIMAFTAFTGSVSHFAIGGMPDLFCLICCVLSTLLWARIAAKFANKAEPATLNRATGVVLVVLGAAILAVNYL